MIGVVLKREAQAMFRSPFAWWVLAAVQFLIAYQFLAQAYGQTGDVANAELATADMHYYGGDMQQAKIFAARAQRQFKTGSPAWLRAEDIIKYKAKKK